MAVLIDEGRIVLVVLGLFAALQESPKQVPASSGISLMIRATATTRNPQLFSIAFVASVYPLPTKDYCRSCWSNVRHEGRSPIRHLRDR